MKLVKLCLLFGLLASLLFVSGCSKSPEEAVSTQASDHTTAVETGSFSAALVPEEGQTPVSSTEAQTELQTTAAGNREESKASVEPVLFTGTEAEIRDQKLRWHLKLPDKYREADNYYFEEILEVTDVSHIMYDFFETDERYYSEEEFLAYDNKELLKLAKNEIYARRGRMFTDPDIYNYFLSKMWYEPRYTPEEFDESCFNKYEKANLEILAKLEEKLNANSAVPISQVEPVIFTGTEDEIVRKKWVWHSTLPRKYRWIDTHYFEDILGYRDASCIYHNFFDTDERYYSEEELTIWDEKEFLKLAKNEIYARRGRMFTDPEIYHYFLTKTWYEPRYTPEEFDESCFNKYEKANLELLVSLGA